jgi:hypothetical protein
MSAVEQWREKYGEKAYRYEYDAEHRLNFATALDETSHKEMREMLEKQADQMIGTLFDQPPDTTCSSQSQHPRIRTHSLGAMIRSAACISTIRGDLSRAT